MIGLEWYPCYRLKYFSFTLKTQAAYFSETSASTYRTATAIRIISTVRISSLALPQLRHAILNTAGTVALTAHMNLDFIGHVYF